MTYQLIRSTTLLAVANVNSWTEAVKLAHQLFPGGGVVLNRQYLGSICDVCARTPGRDCECFDYSDLGRDTEQDHGQTDSGMYYG